MSYLPSFILTTSSMTSRSRFGNILDSVSTTLLCSARWIRRASASSALACRAAASWASRTRARFFFAPLPWSREGRAGRSSLECRPSLLDRGGW